MGQISLPRNIPVSRRDLLFPRVGLLLASGYLLWRLGRSLRESADRKRATGSYLDFGEMSYYDWKNWGFFVNSLGLTAFMLIISYAVLYLPASASND